MLSVAHFIVRIQWYISKVKNNVDPDTADTDKEMLVLVQIKHTGSNGGLNVIRPFSNELTTFGFDDAFKTY